MAYGYASDIGKIDECLSIVTQVASVPVSGQCIHLIDNHDLIRREYDLSG